jgi:hypothetical protein
MPVPTTNEFFLINLAIEPRETMCFGVPLIGAVGVWNLIFKPHVMGENQG